ncbi:MAG: threonine-phosphate decarboxylase CobD [Nitrososphaerota archaeon]
MKFRLEKSIAGHFPVKHGGLYSVKNTDSSVTDFSSNISPLGFPPLVKKAIKKEIQSLDVYPDSDSTKLRSHLEWYTGISKNQIVVGNGATEIIYNFCNAFLGKKTPILIPVPTFGEYEAACKLAGCKVSFFKTMNLNDSLDGFIKIIPKNGCVFLCNPNNPTGVLIPKSKMLEIIKNAKKKNTLVFIDECFIELVSSSNESVVKVIKKFDNLFVLRSLTKSFGLAGIRVGYGLGRRRMISVLNKIKIPWNVSGLAQKAASAALCHSFYLDKTRNLIKKESKYLSDSIAKMSNFSCHSSATNFILIKSKIKSKTLQKKLIAKKILIRDCSNFRGLNDQYIRIAVKSHKENIKLIKSLESIK